MPVDLRSHCPVASVLLALLDKGFLSVRGLEAIYPGSWRSIKDLRTELLIAGVIDVDTSGVEHRITLTAHGESIARDLKRAQDKLAAGPAAARGDAPS